VVNAHKYIVQKEQTLMSQQYLDQISEEINEELQEKSQLAISELSLKFGLPAGFVGQVLAARLGTIVEGSLSSESLSTVSYLQVLRARLKGQLRGCTRFLSLA